MGIGQRGSGKWRRRERVEGEIERRVARGDRLGLRAPELGLGPTGPDGYKWRLGFSLTHSKENKNKTEIRKKRKRG